MKNYSINQNTLALIPLGKDKTVVYDNHDCFIVEKKLTHLLDDSCKYNGSSISGRIKGTYSITGYLYKAPIIINEDKKLIFFPTCSPRLKDCAWINSNNISQIYNYNGKCLIEFSNQECVEIDTSYNIINNQFSRSLQLEKKFNKRS